MNINELILKVCEYNSGDPKRIHHLIKVYTFTNLISSENIYDVEQVDILNTAAILHDIGIHNAEIKYNSTAGKYQEIEGIPVAREILKGFNCNDNFIESVCWLIGHHHSYNDNMPLNLNILMEADFLVNAYEDNLSINAINSVRDKVFKTECGIKLLDNIYKQKINE